MQPARLFAALAVSAVAIAACGSASKPSSTGSASTQALTYANCVRANGTPNFPDPGSNGALPNPALPAFQAAKKACAKLQPAGLHLHGPPAPSATELRAALTFARCMRKHGVSQFPDPLTTVSLVAALTLGPGEYFPAPGPTEFQSPAIRHVSQCLRTAASRGPAVAIPPSNTKRATFVLHRRAALETGQQRAVCGSDEVVADTRGAAKVDPPLRPAPDPPSCLDAHLGADDARPALRGTEGAHGSERAREDPGHTPAGARAPRARRCGRTAVAWPASSPHAGQKPRSAGCEAPVWLAESVQ